MRLGTCAHDIFNLQGGRSIFSKKYLILDMCIKKSVFTINTS